MAIDGDKGATQAVASLQDPALPIEVIVVNTGHGTLGERLGEMLEFVVLVESPNRRLPGGTRNLGVAASTAPVIAFLAADCVATPGWSANRLLTHRNAEAVASAILPMPRADGSVSLVSQAVHVLQYWRRDPDCAPDRTARYGVSYCRDTLSRHGPFSEDTLVGEDTELNARLSDVPVWEPGVVTLHRNPDQLGVAILDSWRRGVKLRRWMSTRAARPTGRAVLWSYGAARDAIALLHYVHPQRRSSIKAALPLVWLLALARIGGVLSQVAYRPPPTAG